MIGLLAVFLSERSRSEPDWLATGTAHTPTNFSTPELFEGALWQHTLLFHSIWLKHPIWLT